MLYPVKGLRFCALLFDRSEASIRAKASALGLKQDRQSEFFKEWQQRAAQSKIGTKRPEQAKVMRRLLQEGKMRMTEAGRQVLGDKVRERIALQGHPRGSLGLKHTDATRRLIGQKSHEHWQSMSEDQKANKTDKMIKSRIENGTLVPPRNASWKAGWRVIGGVNKYYRSRWEANYARYLEWLKSRKQIEDWKHEPTTFWFEGVKRGTRSYLPDFWVKECGGAECYHEVKGWMDDRSKTKIKRMAKYHPGVKLIVIDKKAYQSIAKTMQAFIRDWE